MSFMPKHGGPREAGHNEFDVSMGLRLRSSELAELRLLAEELDCSMADIARDAIQARINELVARGLGRATMVDELRRDGHAVVDLAPGETWS